MIRNLVVTATTAVRRSIITRAALLALVAAAVGTGCQENAQSVSQDRPVAPINEPGFAREWRARLVLAGERVESLFVRDQQIFVYTRDNRSFVLDRGSGELIHVDDLPTNQTIRAPLVLQDRIIYPLNTSLEVRTVKSGRVLRTIQFGRPITTDVVGKDNTVVFGTTEGGKGRILVQDLDKLPSTARAAWTAGGLHGRPALVADRIYFAATDGKVYASDSEMEAVWALGTDGAFRTDGPIFADLAADPSGIYAASTDTKLYCLDPDSGHLKWVYYTGVPLRAAPSLTRDMVYQYVPGEGLAALNKELPEGSDLRNVSQKPRWVYGPGRQLLAEDDRFAYVRTENNRIDALDKQSGKLQFSSTRNDLIVFGTNRTDGMIYAATRDGNVFAIRAVPTPGTVGELVAVPMESSSTALAFAR